MILGLALILGGVASMAAVHPTAGTLESAAQISATLLIAYAVETSWLIRASRHRPSSEREARLGSLTAVGLAAGLGILFSLALADRVQAHHWIWLDFLGLGWVVGSIFFLGSFVVLQPWVTHEWMYEDATRTDTPLATQSNPDQIPANGDGTPRHPS